MSQTFSTGDVASHNKPEDLYIIVDGDVYDLSKFQDDHPGTFSMFLAFLFSPLDRIPASALLCAAPS